MRNIQSEGRPAPIAAQQSADAIPDPTQTPCVFRFTYDRDKHLQWRWRRVALSVVPGRNVPQRHPASENLFQAPVFRN